MLLVSGATHAGMMGHGMMKSGSSGNSEQSPATLEASVRKGYDFTRAYCSQCHTPPDPERHTASEWPRVITRMEHYMRQQGQAHPNADARQEILKYLTRYASR